MVGASFLLRDLARPLRLKVPCLGSCFHFFRTDRPASADFGSPKGNGKSATPARLVAGLTLTIRARLEFLA